MLSFLNVKSSEKNEFVDITGQVQEELSETGLQSGICYVYVPHTTAGVTINEGADPAVIKDIIMMLDKIVPQDPAFSHLEGNSDAHVKSLLAGVSLYIPFEDAELTLGTWQSIYFCEFDGPRHRRVALKFIGK